MKKIALLLLSMPVLASLQHDDFVARILAYFEAYQVHFPQEKVYLHIDRPQYLSGDTLWLKAYCVEATGHQTDSSQKVLYVELIDINAHKIIDTHILKVLDGWSADNFVLSDSLKTGQYQLRAYTNWMRNFPEEFFFHQNISITNHADKTKPNPHLPTSTIQIQFFPEGGNLITNLPNRIAFKATNVYGQSVDIKGFILDNNQDTLQAIRSEHLGLGVFMLKPQIGKTYTAVVHYQEETQTFELPLAQSEGFVMMVNNQPDKVKVFVYHQEPIPQTGKLLLLAQQRGKVCYVAESSMADASFSVNIPIQKFSDDGIVHFTLFTENNVPVCERIVYVNLHKLLKINILADKAQYKPREKVTLQCQVSNTDGIPQEGNFSITVTDAQQMPEKAFTQDIRSYLLFSSDIQGFIENPAYYFDESNAQVTHHLDLLLMTQGWRRFVWKQVLADSLPTPAYTPEYALTLAGSFSRTYQDKIPKDVNLTLMLKDQFEQQILTQVPDLKTNTFKFDNVEYNGLTEIFLGITGKK